MAGVLSVFKSLLNWSHSQSLSGNVIPLIREISYAQRLLFEIVCVYITCLVLANTKFLYRITINLSMNMSQRMQQGQPMIIMGDDAQRVKDQDAQEYNIQAARAQSIF